jgi:cobalt-zinc-cadmium efflux system outer membrane protein
MFRVWFCLVLLFFSVGLRAEAALVETSLTLDRAKTLLAERNRELLAGQRAVEGLQADSVAAGQRPNPTLSVNMASLRLDGYNGRVLHAERQDIVARVDQLIERGGKRELRTAAAEQAVEAGRFDLADLQRQQYSALASAYYDLVLAQEKERINQESADLYASTVKAAEFRLSVGDIAAADVARIRVDALRAQNDLRQSVADREKAQTALAYMIGLESSSKQLQAVDPFPKTLMHDAAWDEALLEQRPDMRAAEARVRQAEKQRDLARAQLTRDITVGIEYEHAPGSDARNAIGGGVSIPLFTSYQFQGEIARAEVNLTAAMEDRERVRAQAIGEIDQAGSDLRAASERAQRFDDAVLDAAQKSADAADFAYQHGAMGVMDLLDARRTLRALQLEAAATHADYAKAKAAWRAATTSQVQ